MFPSTILPLVAIKNYSTYQIVLNNCSCAGYLKRIGFLDGIVDNFDRVFDNSGKSFLPIIKIDWENEDIANSYISNFINMLTELVPGSQKRGVESVAFI